MCWQVFSFFLIRNLLRKVTYCCGAINLQIWKQILTLIHLESHIQYIHLAFVLHFQSISSFPIISYVISLLFLFFFFLRFFLFFPFSPQSPPVHSCVFFVVGSSSCGVWDAASAWSDERCHVRAQDSNQRNTGPPAAERANLTTRPRGQPLTSISKRKNKNTTDNPFSTFKLLITMRYIALKFFAWRTVSSSALQTFPTGVFYLGSFMV